MHNILDYLIVLLDYLIITYSVLVYVLAQLRIESMISLLKVSVKQLYLQLQRRHKQPFSPSNYHPLDPEIQLCKSFSLEVL